MSGEWAKRSLEDVADLIMGQSPPGRSYNSSGDGTAFLQGKAEFGDVCPKHLKWTTEPKKIAPRDSILVSVRAPVGATNLAQQDYAIGRGLAAIVPRDDVDAHYIFYSFRYRQALFEELGTGSTFKSVNKSALASFPLAIPPRDEQRAIAHVLRTVQWAKEQTEQLIAAVSLLKITLMRHLFTYGIHPESTTGSLRQTPFGAIPRGWHVRLLGDCAVIRGGIAKGRDLRGASTIEVPYLRVANVQDGYLDLRTIKTLKVKRDELEQFRLHAGDVLLTEGGDFDKLGRGYIWRGEIDPCVHQNHIFAVRAHPETVLPEYLAYLLQSPYGKRYFLKVGHRTTHLASINKTKVRELPVHLPPLAEQEEISSLLAIADRKIATEQQRRDALDQLFKTLLHELMTGKIRLTDWPEAA